MDWRATLFATRAPGWSILVRLRLGLLYQLIEGGGAWSLVARLAGWRTAGAGVSS